MVNFSKRKGFLRFFSLFLLQLLLIGCSIGTSFKPNEIRSFKGTLIPELSSEPILIEKVSIDLINKEKNKIPLNLPLTLLNYFLSLIKSAQAMFYLYMFMEKLKDFLQHLLGELLSILFLKKLLEMMGQSFIQMQVF